MRLPDSDIRDAVSLVGTSRWDRLRGRRIFLTGGTGFFGRWLVETFGEANARHALGAELVVLSRNPGAFLHRHAGIGEISGVSFHTGDVRSFDAPPGKFDFVLHAATPVIPLRTHRDQAETLDIIIDGTRRTLDFATTAGCKRFLMTSSGAVYGVQPRELAGIPESWTGAPDTTSVAAAYGEGKRAAETLCSVRARLDGFDLRLARCFAFSGPGIALDGHFALGNFIRDALGGEPPRITGDASVVRSYLYGADLAAWLWTYLLADEAPMILNIGSPEAITLGALAGKIRRLLLGEPAGSSDNEHQGGPRYVPDVSLAASSLSLTPTVSLDEAILRMARHASASN